MTETTSSPYSIFEIQPEWVLETEAMGSKDKFWYRSGDSPEWLFKYPQAQTGQHWAEKIAAEVAGCLDILHARVELAVFQRTRGSASESFAREGRELFHGNQIMAGYVSGYDPAKRFRQCDHTLPNIFLALDRAFASPEGAKRAKEGLASYCVLDALIGNTDRHHENWGILRKRTGRRWFGWLAPTFDHASSLGRELLDEGAGRSRSRLLHERHVGRYAERASGAVFWDSTDRHGPSPIELVRRAQRLYPEWFEPALRALDRIEIPLLRQVVERVPADWMSDLAREFAVQLMSYTLTELRNIDS